MRLPIRTLGRPVADVNLSQATTAQQTGPASWTADGELDIPFDRALTPAEVDAVVLQLTSASDAEATLRTSCATYLALSAPTVAQNTAQVKLLTRLVLLMVDRQR